MKNQISTIPLSLFKASAIEYLSFGDNPVTDIPAEIKDLKHLARLNIQLTAIPPDKIEKIKQNLPKNCEVTIEEKQWGK